MEDIPPEMGRMPASDAKRAIGQRSFSIEALVLEIPSLLDSDHRLFQFLRPLPSSADCPEPRGQIGPGDGRCCHRWAAGQAYASWPSEVCSVRQLPFNKTKATTWIAKLDKVDATINNVDGLSCLAIWTQGNLT